MSQAWSTSWRKILCTVMQQLRKKREKLQSEEVKEFFSKEDCAAAEQAVEQRTSCQEAQKLVRRKYGRKRSG